MHWVAQRGSIFNAGRVYRTSINHVWFFDHLPVHTGKVTVFWYTNTEGGLSLIFNYLYLEQTVKHCGLFLRGKVTDIQYLLALSISKVTETKWTTKNLVERSNEQLPVFNSQTWKTGSRCSRFIPKYLSVTSKGFTEKAQLSFAFASCLHKLTPPQIMKFSKTIDVIIPISYNAWIQFLVNEYISSSEQCSCSIT